AMSDRNERYCRDFREGRQACTCEYFTPPSNPDAPYYCRECQHGFSKHPMALDSTRDNSKVNKVRNVQCIMSGTHRLKQLQFRRVTSTKARAASQFDSEDKVAKVASWLLLVNNLDRRQCAHIETANRFSFSQTWTHDEVHHYLQNEVFPLAFEYVNSTEKGKGIGIPSCPWVLISKERLRYEVVNIDNPTGSDLARFRGRPKCPVKDANVIIGKEPLSRIID
ncbi:hypothetical protein C8R48DRAFT_600821, partial [Suillus tomentosus]